MFPSPAQVCRDEFDVALCPSSGTQTEPEADSHLSNSISGFDLGKLELEPDSDGAVRCFPPFDIGIALSVRSLDTLTLRLSEGTLLQVRQSQLCVSWAVPHLPTTRNHENRCLQRLV